MQISSRTCPVGYEKGKTDTEIGKNAWGRPAMKLEDEEPQTQMDQALRKNKYLEKRRLGIMRELKEKERP